ncbi:protein nervous wreck-like isoform X7 [Macrobrachium nipponense]|uniref:protein nervous wreck-like isoform X7 n=1 Tax=Macrobrachium nipponense TaxID=159736 RepID=UPI0030C7B92A
MQPPPRKQGSYLKVCKNLHGEQVSKLQAKNQQECDLLEDIRNFTKQRSTIEKNYGEALCKIAANYQNRKIACVPDIRLEDGSEAWNVYSVWRTVLDETEKLGKARLAAVEVFHQHISEDAKVTRQNKIHYGKKLSEHLKVIQNELQTQVQELDRTKKVYYEEEHVAHDAREKASAAEEKLKRKKGSLFQSIQSLQKNSAKFSAKRDACDEKSAGARNDYLLTLSSCNAHQRRYYEIDFERILRTMECDMYDKVAEYLSLMSRTELLTCSASQASYNKIREQASTVTRGYNLRCYLTFYPMLGQNIQYDFEPCEGDRIEKIVSHDDSSQQALDNESKKCVTRIQKAVKTIRDNTKKIQKLNIAGKPETELPPDVELKLDEFRNAIRKAETDKCKSESKLETLKEGGIEVEDYTKSLDSDSLGVDLDTSLSRSGSSLSVREEIEAQAAEYDGEQPDTDAATTGTEPQSMDSEREDYTQPQEDGSVRLSTTTTSTTADEIPKARQAEPAAWDPISVDWGDPPVTPLPPVTNGPPEDQTTYPKCIVLYNYTAQNPDELSIVENEEVELMGEGDGDGWVQARNYKGEVGFIPENYIEREEDGGSAQAAIPNFATFPEPGTEDMMAGGGVPNTAVSASRGISFSSVEYNLETEEEVAAPPVSFSSIDYSFEGGEEYQGTDDYSSEPPADLPPLPPPTVTAPAMPMPILSLPTDSDTHHSFGMHCRAMYDYEATCPEEITFMEGQIIKILKKSVHDVDDGWWEGEVDGQVGLFPSLVVEECRSDGEPLTPDVFTFQAISGASPCTTPPPHTPPEVPGFLLPPERVIITQPTPVAETIEEALQPPTEQQEQQQQQVNGNAVNYDQPNFELELSGTHQELYSRQFSSSPESETTEKDQQYAELVSSPDVSNQDGSEVPTRKEEVEPSATTTPDVVEQEIDDFDSSDRREPSATTTPTEKKEGCDFEARVIEVCVPSDSPSPPESLPPLPPPLRQGGETEPQQEDEADQPPPAFTPPQSPPQDAEDGSIEPLQEKEVPEVPPEVTPEVASEDPSEAPPTAEAPQQRDASGRKSRGSKGSTKKEKHSKFPFDESSKSSDGLGVAQIIITAATPMVENQDDDLGGGGEDSRAEADQDPNDDEPYPEIGRSECEGEALVLDDEGRQPPPPPAPEGPMEMRMEMEGAEGGARDIDSERSSSPKSPSPSDGPPDLDPEKLKTLERIKESNA